MQYVSKRLFGFLLALSAFSVVIGAQTPTPSPDPVSSPASILTTYDGTTLRKGEFTFAAVYTNPYTVSTEYFDSKLMGKKMPYNILTPESYSAKESSGRRYPVIYLLHGLGGHYDNWASKTKLADYAASYDVIIVTPEGEDGWYTDQPSKERQMYESYIVEELIPEVDRRYRTIAQRDARAMAGLSMGGYGSIKFGLKHPEMFAVVGSFSGTLYGPMINPADLPADVSKSVTATFGPLSDESKKANDLFDLVRRAPADALSKLPFVYFDCGTEDRYFKSNRDFAALLLEKKVPHEFRELPGNHSWKYWDTQVAEFLKVSNRFITVKK